MNYRMNKRERIVHKLFLDTKANIPFPSAQLIIYQPSIAEVALLGESNFFVAINALTKDYKSINLQDNSDLDSLTNFDILMSITREKSESGKLIFVSILQLLELILPNYKIGLTPSSIILQDKDIEEGAKPQPHIIDKNNFDTLSQIIWEMFGVASMEGSGNAYDYNPAGDRARAIVEKFKKRQEYLAQFRKERGEDTATASVFGRYINILAVGEQKDKNQLSQYSVYQLIEEFKRFQMKETFDYTFQARMAGAKNVKDAKDWMQDITLGIEKED